MISADRIVHTVKENRLLLLGLAVAAGYWTVEAAIDSFVFGLGSVYERLIPHDANETWMRLIVLLLIIIFSSYAQVLITRSRRLEAERKDMLSMLAHDMKNPLITAAGFVARLLSGKEGPLTGKQVSRLEIVDEELGLLKGMIADFLEFSRLETREHQPVREAMNLKMELYKTVEMARTEAEKKGVSLLLDIPEDIPDTITADAMLITRATTNLLDNAIKYSPRGGTVEIRLAEKGPHILIKVIDTGIGIPEAHLPHVFDLFYRVNRDAKGSGLGLSIVKKIAEAHGGSIEVESASGKGSTFTLVLPKK